MNRATVLPLEADMGEKYNEQILNEENTVRDMQMIALEGEGCTVEAGKASAEGGVYAQTRLVPGLGPQTQLRTTLRMSSLCRPVPPPLLIQAVSLQRGGEETLERDQHGQASHGSRF